MEGVLRASLGCRPFMQIFAPRSSYPLCFVVLCAGSILAPGCGDGAASTSSGGTATAGSGGGATSTTGSGGGSSTSSSASSGSGGGGGGQSCIEQGHVAGERFSVGDDCNFCDCNADGSTSCTDRRCKGTMPGCTYDGKDHAYAEHFPSTDGCNDCVCAASGLACTRRACTVVEEGAILVESLDTPCGPDPGFTAQAVLDGLPVSDLEAPFLYETSGPAYPEVLPDTTVRFRIVYEGGFAVCRIPAPGQEAFDIEVMAEWITADGSFDEGFHAYLRRNAGGFLDAWLFAAGAPPGGLDGSYDPACPDANGFSFDATLDADGTATGHTSKICETDLLLDVATWSYGP